MKRLVSKVVTSTAVAYLFLANVAFIAPVHGDSMTPNLLNGDWILINRISLQLGFAYYATDGENAIGLPKQGDIVVLSDPHWQPSLQAPRGRLLVKRLLTPSGIELRKGSMWVEGDQPLRYHDQRPYDSRTFGAVPIALLKGKVMARIYPFHRISWL